SSTLPPTTTSTTPPPTTTSTAPPAATTTSTAPPTTTTTAPPAATTTSTAPPATTSTTVCAPTTCPAQGKNCGTISNGCAGPLTCGKCAAPQTCGGGGVANVCGVASCGAGTSQVTLTVTGQPGSVTSNPSGLTVSTGQTASACFPNNQRVEFPATRAA